jgi:hypothetical protein
MEVQQAEMKKQRDDDVWLRADEAELANEQHELWERQQEAEPKKKEKKQTFQEFKAFKLLDHIKQNEMKKEKDDDMDFIAAVLAKEKKELEKEDMLKTRTHRGARTAAAGDAKLRRRRSRTRGAVGGGEQEGVADTQGCVGPGVSGEVHAAGGSDRGWKTDYAAAS